MDAVDRFVHAATRSFACGSTCPPPPDVDWVTRAVIAGVLAPVSYVAAGAGHQLPTRLTHLRAGAAARDMRTVADIATLGRALDRAGIAWAVLKGLVLRDLVFAHPEVRDAADVDVLVSPGDIRRVVDLLIADGAELQPQDWAHATTHRTAEITMRLRHGTLLDLHWHLVNLADLREQVRVPASVLLARRRTVVVDGVRLATLDDLDFALHVMLHACVSGCSQLRWLLDVQQVLLRPTFTPAQVASRAAEWRISSHARLAVESAQQFVDPDLQAWVDAFGRRPPWVRTLAALIRRRPPSGSSVSRHSVHNWYRATRPTGFATAWAVMLMLADGVRHRWRGSQDLVLTPIAAGPEYERWLELAERETETQSK